jgi:hypothetical protein
MQDVTERLSQEARTALKVAHDALERRHKAAAVLTRIELLKCADEHPEVTGFEFEANYEYDDEGGYFWCAILRYAGDQHVSKSERALFADPEDLDGVGTDEDSTPIAFETTDKWTGSITVERLRELVAQASAEASPAESDDMDTDTALADLRRIARRLAGVNDPESQGDASDLIAVADWFASGQFQAEEALREARYVIDMHPDDEDTVDKKSMRRLRAALGEQP